MISTSPSNRFTQSRQLAWWTLALWVLFALSVIPGHLVRGALDYLVIGWWVAALAGIAAGALGIREHRTWFVFALVAALVLVVSSAFYWLVLVEKIVQHDEQWTIATVLRRIWQMTTGGIQGGIRNGSMYWGFATLYRETLMPLLQLLTLATAGYAWLTRGARVQGNS